MPLENGLIPAPATPIPAPGNDAILPLPTMSGTPVKNGSNK